MKHCGTIQRNSSLLWWGLTASIAMICLVVLIGWPAPGGGALAIDPPGQIEETPERRRQALYRLDAALELIAERSNTAHISNSAIRSALQPLLHDEHDADKVLSEPKTLALTPLFVTSDGPTVAADALLAELAELESHGVDAVPFQLEALSAAITTTWNQPPPRIHRVKLTEDAHERALGRLAKLAIMPSPTVLADRLVSNAYSPLFQPILASNTELLMQEREGRAWELAQVEAMFLGVASRYASKMGPARADSASRRLRHLLVQLDHSRRSEIQSRKAIQHVEPIRGEYHGLRQALNRYQSIAVEGGWTMVHWPTHEAAPKDGESSHLVTTLRRRLGQEGFFDGESEGSYDSDVRAGLRKARECYGLTRWGGLDRELVKRLNVPVEVRLTQLALNLHRWRQVPIDANQTYVRINVPSGQGELVRNGTRVLQFDVETSQYAPSMSGHIALIRDNSAGDLTFVLADRGTALLGTSSETALLHVRQGEVLAERLMRLTGQASARSQLMHEGQLHLNPHIPVHVTYLTSTTDPKGRLLQFHDDTHSLDRLALKQPERPGAPSWLRW